MYKIIITTIANLFLFILVHCNILLASETIVPVYGLLMSAEDGLSETQRTFIKFIGYPQQFIKNFDAKDGQKRVNETWVYASLGMAASFINGQLVEEKTLGVSDPALAPGGLHPEDYQLNDTQGKILLQHESPLTIRSEQVWNGIMVTYLYENVIFGFHNGALKSVVYYTNQEHSSD